MADAAGEVDKAFLKAYKIICKDDEQQGQDGPSTVVRFFERSYGDGENAKIRWTVHGENARLVARVAFRTESVVQDKGPKDDEQLPTVTVVGKQLECAVSSLLSEYRCKVEIWTNNNSMNKWEKKAKASPGNREQLEQEMDLSGSTSTPVMGSVNIQMKASGALTVGVAFCDSALKTVAVGEFDDNGHYTNLEAALVQTNVAEALICLDTLPGGASGVHARKVTDVLGKAGVNLTVLKRSEMKTDNLTQDMANLLALPDSFTDFQSTKQLAMPCVSALVRYLELVSLESNFAAYHMQGLNLDSFLRMDGAALKALNVLPSPRDTHKTHSVFGLLNHCKTKMGPRILTRWLKQPLRQEADINRRLDIVEAFATDIDMRVTVQEDVLRKTPDLDFIMLKLVRRKGFGLELAYKLYTFLDVLPNLQAALDGYDEEGVGASHIRDYFAYEVGQAIQQTRPLCNMVEASIDLDRVAQHQYNIRPHFDAALKELAEARSGLEGEIEGIRKAAARTLKLDEKKVHCENAKQYGMCLRITKTEEKQMRQNNPSGRYIILGTQNKGVFFTCEALKPLSKQLKQVQKEYNEKQDALVSKAVDVIASYIPVLTQVSDLVSELDVLISFAHASQHALGAEPYCRPEMTPAGSGYRLSGARHPCVEVQDDVRFISNDCDLVPGESQLCLLTGPNMGGKSTYIRQVGVIVLMAHVGCFVPCDGGASVALTDAIYCRVGAGDNQMRGVSTFMAEMLETSTILEAATRESLIIVDELGRGTSTYDGFGLAWAISSHIAKAIGAPCLFATHFHELTALSDELPGKVVNRHVTAHASTGELVMMYEVKEGSCDQSFGIHVAKMCFPAEVVKAAERKLAELEQFGSVQQQAGAGAVSSPMDLALTAPVASTGMNKRPLDENEEATLANMTTPDSKKQRVEADVAIKGFLKAFAALPVPSMESGAVIAKVKEMKEKLDSRNPFLSQMLLRSE